MLVEKSDVKVHPKFEEIISVWDRYNVLSAGQVRARFSSALMEKFSVKNNSGKLTMHESFSLLSAISFYYLDANAFVKYVNFATEDYVKSMTEKANTK